MLGWRVVTVVLIVSGVTGCGASSTHRMSITGGIAVTTAVTEGAVRKQGAVKIDGCFRRDGIRPARLSPVPHQARGGDTGLVRKGERLTLGEVQAAVRRCEAK